MAFPLCVPRKRERGISGSSPLLIETLILLDEGPTLMTSFNLNHLPKGCISKQSHAGGIKTVLSRLTLWDSMNCSLPGSSVHGNSPGKNTGVGGYHVFFF